MVIGTGEAGMKAADMDGYEVFVFAQWSFYVECQYSEVPHHSKLTL